MSTRSSFMTVLPLLPVALILLAARWARTGRTTPTAGTPVAQAGRRRSRDFRRDGDGGRHRGRPHHRRVPRPLVRGVHAAGTGTVVVDDRGRAVGVAGGGEGLRRGRARGPAVLPAGPVGGP